MTTERVELPDDRDEVFSGYLVTCECIHSPILSLRAIPRIGIDPRSGEAPMAGFFKGEPFGQEWLYRHGPRVPVWISAPGSRSGLSGAMLIDTGADKSCILREAADALGLAPVMRATANTSGASHEAQIVEAEIDIVGSEERPIYRGRARVLVAPQLPVRGVLPGEPEPLGPPLGLLGRDILGSAVLTYDGPSGGFSLTFP